MNGKMVRYILGRMLGVEALLLLLPAFVGILYGEEKEALTFVIPAVILTCIFVIAGRKRPEGQVIYGKEGMVVVASAWITWSLFGALPFTLSGSIPNFVDAFFETVSGFTTTGSSILRDVEALPTVYAVLAKFHSLDWRYGSACLCSDADESGQEEFHVSDACRSSGTGER